MIELIAIGMLAIQPGFAVASIKVSTQPPSGIRFSPGHVSARGVSLKTLIAEAYGVNPLQVSGGAEWVASSRFEIEAKSEAAASRDELLKMLQQLLADRFKLSLHGEKREIPVERLVMGKGASKPGSALKPAAATDIDPAIRAHVASRSANANRIEVSGRNVTLPYLANYLAGRTGRLIIDQTGLGGAYDFEVETALDPVDASDPKVPERDVIRNMFADVAEKLGLKLVAQKSAVEVLIIDHAELPTAN
jgi:uncharacterized protein (TIGR03435 family)